MWTIFNKNNNVWPTLAINGVRLKETGFLRYASCSASSLLGFYSSQTRLLYYSTNVPSPVNDGNPDSLVTHSDSLVTPFSEQWCKEKKAEIYKNKLPAIFEDMSKMKESGYFASTNFREKPLSFYSLDKIPGVYMITNKITKKFYIGFSKDLKERFYNYMDLNRLNRDKATRINKALIKYGFENFSISILELHKQTVQNSYLREREDFCIKVFKPQYNIKRSKFNLDVMVADNYKAKTLVDIPLKIKNLLDDSLDPANLQVNLINLQYSTRKDFYVLTFTTPKYLITANSTGWFQGNISKPIGLQCKRLSKSITLKSIISYYTILDPKLLANLYPKEISNFAKDRLKMKIKALKKAAKSEGK